MLVVPEIFTSFSINYLVLICNIMLISESMYFVLIGAQK